MRPLHPVVLLRKKNLGHSVCKRIKRDYSRFVSHDPVIKGHIKTKVKTMESLKKKKNSFGTPQLVQGTFGVGRRFTVTNVGSRPNVHQMQRTGRKAFVFFIENLGGLITWKVMKTIDGCWVGESNASVQVTRGSVKVMLT